MRERLRVQARWYEVLDARQVVRALPRKLREPFLLAASGDHRYEDIAVMLAIPVGTVKWRISQARKMIRAKLDRLGHGPQSDQGARRQR